MSRASYKNVGVFKLFTVLFCARENKSKKRIFVCDYNEFYKATKMVDVKKTFMLFEKFSIFFDDCADYSKKRCISGRKF
jgi:hypothetical protein